MQLALILLLLSFPSYAFAAGVNFQGVSLGIGSATFAIGVVPDTQYVHASETWVDDAATFFCQARANFDTPGTHPGVPEIDFRFVVHTGDIVDATSQTDRFQNISDALDILDACGLPYAYAAGNHDADNAGTWCNGLPISEGICNGAPMRTLFHLNDRFGPGGRTPQTEFKHWNEPADATASVINSDAEGLAGIWEFDTRIDGLWQLISLPWEWESNSVSWRGLELQSWADGDRDALKSTALLVHYNPGACGEGALPSWFSDSAALVLSISGHLTTPSNNCGGSYSTPSGLKVSARANWQVGPGPGTTPPRVAILHVNPEGLVTGQTYDVGTAQFIPADNWEAAFRPFVP